MSHQFEDNDLMAAVHSTVALHGIKETIKRLKRASIIETKDENALFVIEETCKKLGIEQDELFVRMNDKRWVAKIVILEVLNTVFKYNQKEVLNILQYNGRGFLIAINNFKKGIKIDKPKGYLQEMYSTTFIEVKTKAEQFKQSKI
jgi:hypothetical protein